MNIFKVNGKISYGKLITSLVVTFIAALIGTLASMGAKDYYSTLTLPRFAPPAAVFAPVWTVLFILMAIAAYRVWMYGTINKNVSRALILYVVQLAFNALWSVLFFSVKNNFLALIDIIILFVLIVIITMMFRQIDKIAAALFVPYVLWVGFATILNASVWILNR